MWIIFFLVLVLVGIVVYVLQSKRSGSIQEQNGSAASSSLLTASPEPDSVIATIGETKVYQAYVTKELKLYPATKSAEVKEKLKQKVIDDQITLVEAKKEGIITSFNENKILSDQEYIERTKQVRDIRKKIEDARDSLSGALISIGFFQGKSDPQTLAKNQELALSKINPVYEKLKNKQISLADARVSLYSDPDLKRLDPALATNVSVTFQIKQGNPITFWGDLDKMLWDTAVGDVSPLYYGKAQDNDGNIVQGMYVFGVIDNKTQNKGYANFNEWLNQKKKNYDLTTVGLMEGILKFMSVPSIVVYAQDGGCCDSSVDNGNNNDNGGNANDGNLSNQNHTQDNPPNTCDHIPNSSGDSCGGGGGGSPPPPLSPAWAGTITTETGATLPGANVTIVCSSGSGNAVSNDSGAYYSAPISGVNYTCSPATVTATYGGQPCESKQVPIPNSAAVIYTDLTCTLGPPACNKACPSSSYCEGAEDGCTVCMPNDQGTFNVCRKPPACGVSCALDSQCAGAQDGCSACLPNDDGSAKECRQVPACNVTCVHDGQCAGARDGCSVCLPNDSGDGKVCRQAPACGVSCALDSQCAGAQDGCSSCLPNDAGTGNECRQTPACGVGCTRDGQCVGARDGCTSCLPNDANTASVCSEVPACGKDCVHDGQCAGAKDGCSACLPKDQGEGKECRQPAACGVACTRNGQCAGAKDGCTECAPDENMKEICSEPFGEDMCKCDGFEATNLKYPTDKNFTFSAFVKILKKNINRAKVNGVEFTLYKSNKSDPTKATVVARSGLLPVSQVENTAEKTRYKAAWNVAPPAFDKNALFRVGAKISCARKNTPRAEGISSQNTLADTFMPGGNIYDSDSSKVLASFETNADYKSGYSPFSLAQNDGALSIGGDDSLNLGELNFVRMIDTDACSFLRFEYQDY